MNLMSLNCIFKRGKVVNLCYGYFTTKKESNMKTYIERNAFVSCLFPPPDSLFYPDSLGVNTIKFYCLLFPYIFMKYKHIHTCILIDIFPPNKTNHILYTNLNFVFVS